MGKNATFWGSTIGAMRRRAGLSALNRLNGDRRSGIHCILRDAERVIGLQPDTLQRVVTKTNRSLALAVKLPVRGMALEQQMPMPPSSTAADRRRALWDWWTDGRQPGVDEHAIRTPRQALDADERTHRTG